MKNVLLFIILLIANSKLFAQNEKGINQAGIKNNDSEIANKTWNTTEKGNIIQVFSTKTGYAVLFPNNLIYEVNTEESTIIVADETILNKPGGPIVPIVKGGKNPGGQMRAINESGVSVKNEPKKPKGKGHNFELPDDWSDGNYKLEISIEPNEEDKRTSKKVKNGGVITGTVVINQARFILTKNGTSTAIQSQSIVNTTKSTTKD